MNEPGDIKNDPGADLMRLVGAATNALSDDMVGRMASTVGNLLEVADQLNNEDTRDALVSTMEWLTRLHRGGALDTAFSLVEVLHCGRMAMTDPMINRLLGFIEHMVNNLANEEMATMVSETFIALQDAVEESKNTPMSSGGILATIKLLTKPETLQTLRFMLSISEKIKEQFQK